MTITLLSRHGDAMTITTARRDRPAQRTIHPLRRATGAALAAAGACAAVVAVVTGVTVLLGGAAVVIAGFVVSHRWTRVRATPSRLASERDASADYVTSRRPAA